MNPRELNRVINVLRAQKRTATGGQSEILGWPIRHAGVPAKIEDGGGGAKQRGNQTETTVTSAITIRYLADLQATDRLQLLPGGQVKEIGHIEDLEGNQQWLKVHVHEVQ